MAKLEKPAITKQPTSTITCEGKEVSFEAEATGNPAPVVQWEVSAKAGDPWIAEIGAVNETLTVVDVGYDQNGARFRAVFANRAGIAKTDAATLTVHTPPRVTEHPKSVEIEAGQVAVFESAAIGDPPPAVAWQSLSSGSWQVIANETSTKLSIHATNALNGTEYRARFSNQCNPTGTLTFRHSRSATLSVAGSPSGIGEAHRPFHLLLRRLTEATEHMAGIDEGEVEPPPGTTEEPTVEEVLQAAETETAELLLRVSALQQTHSERPDLLVQLQQIEARLHANQAVIDAAKQGVIDVADFKGSQQQFIAGTRGLLDAIPPFVNAPPPRGLDELLLGSSRSLVRNQDAILRRLTSDVTPRDGGVQ